MNRPGPVLSTLPGVRDRQGHPVQVHPRLHLLSGPDDAPRAMLETISASVSQAGGPIPGVHWLPRGMSAPDANDVSSLSGLVLIEDLGTHLHPAQHAGVPAALLARFPDAQIIATTTSPQLLQVLPQAQVSLLERRQDTTVRLMRLDVGLGLFGMQGWTVEEILRDALRVPVVSPTCQAALDSFHAGLDRDDAQAAAEGFRQLKAMTHPFNGMKRVYGLQFESIGGVEETGQPKPERLHPEQTPT